MRLSLPRLRPGAQLAVNVLISSLRAASPPESRRACLNLGECDPPTRSLTPSAWLGPRTEGQASPEGASEDASALPGPPHHRRDAQRASTGFRIRVLARESRASAPTLRSSVCPPTWSPAQPGAGVRLIHPPRGRDPPRSRSATVGLCPTLCRVPRRGCTIPSVCSCTDRIQGRAEGWALANPVRIGPWQSPPADAIGPCVVRSRA